MAKVIKTEADFKRYVVEEFARLGDMLRAMNARDQRMEDIIMALRDDVKRDIGELLQQERKQTTVLEGIGPYIDGLNQKIADLEAAAAQAATNEDGAAMQEVAAALAQLREENAKQNVVSALWANTPQASEVPNPVNDGDAGGSMDDPNSRNT